MRLNESRRLMVLALLATTLSACASRYEAPAPVASAEEDDAYCRANNVKVGSPEYIYCRRERDAQHNQAIARADRRQRDLGEYMMNHPDHP
jgi:hypothetical protein